MTKWKHNMVLQNVLEPLERGIDPRAVKVKYILSKVKVHNKIEQKNFYEV